ncbi:MAG: orotidine-5'-phosphate decarboxylase [Pseudomonadota bacterium]|nr:orotidine-5'-phosphate decarboxylase [Pseudomonadota bacterium]|tara:strand:+ start:278 stop:952 length:675 start_codon:yes stop_codon:yes gene_type:complete
MANSKIIIAIDSYEYDQASHILEQLNPSLCMIKIGSITFNSLGKEFIYLAHGKGFEIFLDLKLHDIPNTVQKSIEGLITLPIKMLTIHTSGGIKMMQAAMQAVKDIEIKIFGVTVLTSLSDEDTNYIFRREAQDQVKAMLDLAEEARIDGIVCSPHELHLVTPRSSLLSITPGIRFTSSDDDQRRIMTPKQAIELGADFIVIGRPITESNNISKSLNDLSEQIK